MIFLLKPDEPMIYIFSKSTLNILKLKLSINLTLFVESKARESKVFFEKNGG